MDNQVYRDEKANGALQEVPVEMISMQAKRVKLVLMEGQEEQATKENQGHQDMKVRGDKWVKWDQEAVLVSHQKDQEEIQESEDQKVLEDQRVSKVSQEKGAIFR